ncbi:S24 family peptidase [Terrihabitans sp. B22-R8]|uniref:S24 family peptidase n=1 Tax=Terrihabitans sp. B22-R8 TaxID=3425128 RepID=UPI00403CF641
MLTHSRIWSAIDRLAETNGLSASALAKRAGLDPTTFNRSKRIAADGRPRWPSTESIAKILQATGASLESFLDLLIVTPRPNRAVPLIGLAQAGTGGFFTDAGFPVGTGWEEVSLPAVDDEHAYALEISGDSMLPLYRNGDVIVVSPSAEVRRGDRVVLKTTDGEVLAKELTRRTTKLVELRSFNPEHADRTIPLDQVAWIARILWSSQ